MTGNSESEKEADAAMIGALSTKTKTRIGFWGPFLETPDNFPSPVSIFFEFIYLSANGSYWCKLSDMLTKL